VADTDNNSTDHTTEGPVDDLSPAEAPSAEVLESEADDAEAYGTTVEDAEAVADSCATDECARCCRADHLNGL